MAALTLLFVHVTACEAGMEVSKAYQLKAAFLYKFIKFVEWPPQSFADAQSPIVIGVLGINPFGSELEDLVRDRTINGRSIVVRSVQGGGSVKGMHILFVSESEQRRFEALKGMLPANVLTVGESPAFAQEGGIIVFTLDGDKLRFEINMVVAGQGGLKINAQLQKLATVVRKKS
ncbi:MAG: YfiR family protein [Verrucomicrobiota bacterium]